MHSDRHASFLQSIDAALAGAATPQQQQALREHLENCGPCRQYQESSRHAIASLHGFSFKIDPSLTSRTLAALEAHAQQLETKRAHRLHVALGCVFACLFTIAGSLAASKISSLIAALFPVEASQVHIGVVTFWIIPSICICLLLVLVLITTSERDDKKGLLV